MRREKELNTKIVHYSALKSYDSKVLFIPLKKFNGRITFNVCNQYKILYLK